MVTRVSSRNSSFRTLILSLSSSSSRCLSCASPVDDDSDSAIRQSPCCLQVKKMHTAVRLNTKIREKSSDAQLIVVNLPKPPHSRIGLQNYMEYMEVRATIVHLPHIETRRCSRKNLTGCCWCGAPAKRSSLSTRNIQL